MKFLFDFFPILLFFIAYKVFDIYVATAVAIAASFFQVGFYWWKHHRVEYMHIVTLVLIVVFGGATLLLHDDMFIKWKPTLVNWLFGAVFLGSRFIGNKPVIQRMLGHNFNLPSAIWQQLNLLWTAFFLGIGALNLYIAYQFDTDTWVNFKMFGMMGLTILFVIGQSMYLARYIKDDDVVSRKQE